MPSEYLQSAPPTAQASVIPYAEAIF